MKSARRRLPSSRPKSVFGGAGVKLVYVAFAALLATNVATGLALYWSPDVTALLDRQQDGELMLYQDKIAQLRLEVDRLHSRQYARAGDINLQLQDLMQQQELLEEQQQYVKTLAGMAAELGLETSAITPPPRPQIITPGPTLDQASGDQSVDAVASEIEQMQAETLGALSSLTESAEQSTRQILSEMNRIGLDPEIEVDGDALGGPFVPVDEETGASAHIVAANDVIQALARLELAREAVRTAPVHKPLLGSHGLSSGFGTRSDPFSGRAAFHSGLDFRAAMGTEIYAAGSGKVVFAGRNGGYGNMIDIDHGDGIVTRYGHLSRIEVRVGQMLDVGDAIGQVGSTGRSTGPHLHFEVRRDDQAVDPGIYLGAGSRLAELI